MYPLSDAWPLQYVRRLLLVVISLLIGTRFRLLVVKFLSTPDFCATLTTVSQWNDLYDPVFHGVGLTGFKSRVNAFLLAETVLSFCLLPFYFFFIPRVGCVGLESTD